MDIFQAKTIQKIIGIPKHRYSYILMKVRIEPDVEKVIGTGNTNLFSFKKLMEFAIASTAIDIGIHPDIIIASLAYIENADVTWNLHLFDQNTKTNKLSYHTGFNLGAFFYCFSGDVTEKAKWPTIIKTKDNINFEYSKGDDPHTVSKVIQYWESVIMQGINNALGYSTLNLSEIKKNILSKL